MAIIVEQTGDIFSAPTNTILMHACNAKGVWGAGVALAFKRKFPKAFRSYKAHCNLLGAQSTQLANHQSSLAGTTFLIPPSFPKENHWVACLFTSVGYGRSVDSPERILTNTERAVADLGRQIADIRASTEDASVESKPKPGETKIEKVEDVLGECWAVRINSGKFGVDWDRTKVVLENGAVDMRIILFAEPNAKEGEAEQGLGMKEVDDENLPKGKGNIGVKERGP